jgi:hypothetical protein
MAGADPWQELTPWSRIVIIKAATVPQLRVATAQCGPTSAKK